MRSVHLGGVVLALGLAIAGALGACSDKSTPTTPQPPPRPPTPEVVQRPAPTLRVLAITDLKGYLAPCGCTSRPLGGIDRMAHRVRALAGEGPTVLVAVGATLFGGVSHDAKLGESARDQELWKAETLAEILHELDIAALTPTALDFGYGGDAFTAALTKLEAPALVAGAQYMVGEGEAARNQLSASTTREVAGIKVGIVGVGSLANADGSLPDGVTQAGPSTDAARTAVEQLRAEGANLVIALVTGSRRDARQALRAVPGIDFAVLGGIDQEEAIAPVDAESGFIVHGGRQGQGLLVLDIYRRGEGGYDNASQWNREVERERLSARIDSLSADIERWKTDGTTPAADVQQQEARLARMREEHQALEGQVALAEAGNAFSAEWVELPPDHPQFDTVTQQVLAYDRRVNQHNREVFADLVPEPPAAGEARYIGSRRCESCHSAAYSWWRSTPHGRAYQTLVDLDKQFNLSCVGCHVTGYNQPGGSTVTHNMSGALVDVGCEVCHGPASKHVAAPTNDEFIRRDAPVTTCVRCHNAEHSDEFSYEVYRPQLIAPGHGQAL